VRKLLGRGRPSPAEFFFLQGNRGGAELCHWGPPILTNFEKNQWKITVSSC